MDPLQRGPTLVRPDLDEDGDLGWPAAEGPKPPAVHVSLPPASAWARPRTATAWAAAPSQSAPATTPPAWGDPAPVADLVRAIEKLVGIEERPQPHPPLDARVRTRNPVWW